MCTNITEGPGSVPSIPVGQFTISSNSSYKISDTLYWSTEAHTRERQSQRHREGQGKRQRRQRERDKMKNIN